MREIGSHDLEAKLAELNELELQTAFKAMVGCDGKKIFVAISEDAFDYFSKDSKYYKFKELLIERKDFVIEFASAFGLDAEPLYKEIENIIKDFCKEFNMTYSQLAKAIGYKTDTINKAASTGNISEQIRRAIELYEDNITLRNSINEYFQLKAMLKNMIK
ncbi:metal ABC transporter substrate-binding protein [Aliarcobacter butzleri]|uniref:metal ABC transporter substrate-binding protein n=1 Tax=Aliarcobacter butzleri TaxID=28197 RepID=UPI0021B3F42F|nr:metal ABC transporter substrate-binding protein [Aliarcobacter butzleri]MCT7596399.1 metal ABC transporter substrate-binding protein [Aliarcobacter butzleri]